MCHGEEVVDLVVAWLKVKQSKSRSTTNCLNRGKTKAEFRGKMWVRKGPWEVQQENLPFEYLPGASPDEQGSI